MPKDFLSTDGRLNQQRDRGKAVADCELTEPVVFSEGRKAVL